MIRSIILLLSILIITSCGKDDATEYDDARNQIIGVWQLNEFIETEDIGQFSTTSTKTEAITFNTDGSGNRQTTFTGVQDFEWIYQLSPEKVSIITEPVLTTQGFISTGENRHFDVLLNETSIQQWISNDNAIFFSR